MKTIPFLTVTLLTMAVWSQAAEIEFHVPVPVSRIALDESDFAPFADAVMSEVAPRLAQEDPVVSLKMLLAMQVHIALHRGEAQSALVAAKRIQASLPEGPIHDYAGLTARALVHAQQSTGRRSGDSAFNKVFADEFAAQLATLPKTPKIRTVLEQQVAKYTALTVEAVHREIAAFAETFGTRDHCTLEEADQLVRWRHRLADLVPLRDEILWCLEAAIAVRQERN